MPAVVGHVEGLVRVGGPGVGAGDALGQVAVRRRGGREQPEGAVDVHPGAVPVRDLDRLGERVVAAGVHVAGLEADHGRAVVPGQRAARGRATSSRPWSSARHRLRGAEAEVAQRQVDGVVPLLARPAPAPRGCRPDPVVPTSQPARRSTASRPAARQVKLAIVPPVTKPTALPSGSPSRSSSHALGDLLGGGGGRGEPGQPGVLVPGADQPVRGQRGRVRAADHHPVEPAGRHRGQPGLERRGQVLDDRGGVLRSVRQRGAEPLDELLDLRLRRHRPVVERVQPPLGVLDGDGQGLAPRRSVTVGRHLRLLTTECSATSHAAPARASLSARRTLRASARPPRSGERATTPAVISQGLARTSAFSPYRRWTVKRLRYM